MGPKIALWNKTRGDSDLWSHNRRREERPISRPDYTSGLFQANDVTSESHQ